MNWREVMDEVREAGREPVPVWITPFGYAISTREGWKVLDLNNATRIDAHADMTVEA